MAIPIVRLGDTNNGGGSVLGPGASTVLANGIPLSFPGNSVAPHPPCGPRNPIHCGASVTSGVPTVLAEGVPVVVVGVPDSCGHARATGSPNVLVGT